MDTDPAVLDAQLAAIDWTVLPKGAVRDRVTAPSGALARVTMGPDRAQRVVLVPGATGSKEDFLLMVPLLAAAGFRVESFDMAGQYQSAGAGPEQLDPPAAQYSLGLFVDDLIAVLEAGPTPVHLLGYSFAGTVAAVAATRRPDLISTLTLLSTPPLSGRTLRGIKVVGFAGGIASPRVSAAVLVQGLRWNLAFAGRPRRKFVRDRLRQTRRSSVRDIMQEMTAAPDFAGRLQEKRIPTLVAVGRGDLWPIRRHRGFAASAGAEIAVYRAGHAPCEAAPHQLVADMLRLFEKARPAS